MSNADTNKKPQQRALVLQGGGALGAYEAGVFSVLYHWIRNGIREDKDNNNNNIFDIVAGTSIGAINAAIIVSHVKQSGGWNSSVVGKLKEFWRVRVPSNPNLGRWWPYFWDENSWTDAWDALHKVNSTAATGEAARRYYSAKEFIINGASNVFSPSLPMPDNKFFDNFVLPYNPIPNIWIRYSNGRLKETIKQFANFPIATDSAQNQQPRLLVVSVDVEEAETVTFDSYPKTNDGSRKTEYAYNEKTGVYEFVIEYDKGIMAEHIMASASVPVHYDYTLVPLKYDYTLNGAEREEILKGDIQQNTSTSYRRFWDGGILSNTPLREVIQAHQDYWKTVKKLGNAVPDLEVYVVDVWPSMDKYPVPSDYDGVVDRRNDLTYQDKTPYDEKVANIVSDYYNLAKDLIKLAKEKKIPDNEINAVLSKEAKGRKRTGQKRTYGDLLDKRFDITKIIRIERSADTDDISNKWCDFSSDTISGLFKQGIRDALNTLVKDIKNDKGIQAANDQLDVFINEIKLQKTDQDGEDDTYILVQSAQNTKTNLSSL
jgi:NTE family protein